MKKRLIYGIGIYHIQTKPGSLSGVLNIQPFRGRSQVGSDPSHFTAAAPPPCSRVDAHLLDLPNISSRHQRAGLLFVPGRTGGDPTAGWKSSQFICAQQRKSSIDRTGGQSITCHYQLHLGLPLAYTVLISTEPWSFLLLFYFASTLFYSVISCFILSCSLLLLLLLS